jgi:hypothetical protein
MARKLAVIHPYLPLGDIEIPLEEWGFLTHDRFSS